MIEIVKVFRDNLCYCIRDRNSSEVIVIDPGDFDTVDSYLKNHELVPSLVLGTHHHWDHCGGALQLAEKYSCKFLMSKEEASMLKANPLNDEEIILWNGLQIAALKTPGHTNGHMCYWLKNENAIFCGDLIFVQGCGGVFEGTVQEMHSSIMKIAKFPHNTKLYCGHDYALYNSLFAASTESSNVAMFYRLKLIKMLRNDVVMPTTVLEELETNPFFRCSRTELMDGIGIEKGSSPVEVFKAIVELKIKNR